MDTPELVDMWLLRHPEIHDAGLPDCVCFERHEQAGTLGVTEHGFKVCQYSSRHVYDHTNPPSSGIYSAPVHLVRCGTHLSRNLWDDFIRDGWIPVDTATPEGCRLAAEHFRACKYRDAVSNMYSWNHFTGGYPDHEGRSDMPSEFFLVSAHPNGIDSYHPVTRMPRLSRLKRRSSRRMYTNPPPNSNYAMEA